MYIIIARRPVAMDGRSGPLLAVYTALLLPHPRYPPYGNAARSLPAFSENY